MPRYSKSVLFVDDNPADRILFSRYLQKHGFEVIATGSAEEAMSAIVSGDIGCMVTDQIMAVTGHELASLAAGVRRDLGVVFISGASEQRAALPSGALFVPKENRDELIRAVVKCMAACRIDKAEEK